MKEYTPEERDAILSEAQRILSDDKAESEAALPKREQPINLNVQVDQVEEWKAWHQARQDERDRAKRSLARETERETRRARDAMWAPRQEVDQLARTVDRATSRIAQLDDVLLSIAKSTGELCSLFVERIDDLEREATALKGMIFRLEKQLNASMSQQQQQGLPKLGVVK
jgi:alpha-L-arabinofuranosidase